ncbi:GNAT family N-acetyltransferase [Deinococcus sp. KSM4-11]|uniref:GNAT family N-acetyltransferase n=1 Tax=Deinococcus sp. KSM4-11 TaxID=2568654 RepID=UPI0010A420C6|nr:GNAT family N-acetyltransferase [Deinococcus sp. KSM4-11]THF88089.1 GNAT family N-acetyltransferase [Deinococcus sp. KSM4-11]
MPTIRPARESDRDALYSICLETGDSGEDATGLYADPLILGHVYAGPYLSYAPDFAFVLEDAEGVGGYVIGTPDSRAFEATLEREWWPKLRAQYPDPAAIPRESRTPDERIMAVIHDHTRKTSDVYDAYPAHLHIDLLPRMQGGGNGRALMERLFTALRDAGVPGVHLGVGGRNTRAQGFYQHLGFRELERTNGGITLGYML